MIILVALDAKLKRLEAGVNSQDVSVINTWIASVHLMPWRKHYLPTCEFLRLLINMLMLCSIPLRYVQPPDVVVFHCQLNSNLDIELWLWSRRIKQLYSQVSQKWMRPSFVSHLKGNGICQGSWESAAVALDPIDGVLEHVSEAELRPLLEHHIKPGTPLCADAHLAHEAVAKKLPVLLKELVISSGLTVLEDVFHIQHVNAYHSYLKGWINYTFHGVATRYLYRYQGWRRLLSSKDLNMRHFLERVTSHWAKPLLI